MLTTWDSLLTYATVLTMDEDFHVFETGFVAVTGDRIVAVGGGSLAGEFRAGERVDCGGQVLMPGLINAHTHPPMTPLRGLAHHPPPDVRPLGYIMPAEREFVNPDFLPLGTP